MTREPGNWVTTVDVVRPDAHSGELPTDRPSGQRADPIRHCPAVTSPVRSTRTWGGSVESVHIMELLREFVAEREWGQFHSPENLAKSISIEAAELLECFQWSADASNDRIEEELADVLTYCLLLADRIGADPVELIRSKLEVTREKYPVEKSRSRSMKYDRL